MTERGASPNAHERDKPGTSARDRSEGRIEGVRDLGGVFVEAVRATRLPMVLTDPTLPGDPIVFANQAFLELSGYAMAEVLGQSPHFMDGPDTDPEDVARFEQILADDEDGVVETIQYAKDGRRFVATVLLSAFKGDDGRTIHHFLSWTDVTRRVAAEHDNAVLRTTQAALRESEAKYRGLFDAIDEGFCVIEVLFDEAERPVDYVFIETNPVFERQTGLVDAVGKRMRDLAPRLEQHWFDIYGEIAKTGESHRFERPAEALGRWYDVYAFRVGRPEERRVAIRFNDISERKRASHALAASEERQKFLLTLGDEMRTRSTAEEKIEVAARLLGDRLSASRVLYAEYDWVSNVADIFSGWLADGAQSFPAVMQLGEYDGEVLSDLRAGRTVRVDDVSSLASEPAYAAIAELGVQALLSVPLLVDGTLKVNLSIHQHEPRHWTDEEVRLVQDVAERLWSEVVRARGEAALRESEQRLRDFGDASQDVLWIRNVETLQWTYLTQAFERIYGVAREEALEGDNYRNWLDMVLPEDRDHAEACVAKVSVGENVSFEYRIRRPDGSIRWLRDTDFPIRDAGGKVVLFGGIGQDITGLKRAEAARSESEERLRLIVENAQDYAIFTMDPDGICTDWREGAEAVFGFSRDEMIGKSCDIVFTPEDRAEGEPAKERAIAAAEGKAPDVRWHMCKNGTRVFIDGVSTALRGSDGVLIGFLKIGQDTTERHASEERQKLLLAELQHRVRNILAMIRSMVRQSSEGYDDVEEFTAHFMGRVDALARTQVLLTRAAGAKVELESMVWDELHAQLADDAKVTVRGPRVNLSAKAAEVLSLALHELATNSIKYGALNDSNGRLSVTWGVGSIADEQWLQMTWEENCPDLQPRPIRTGFGTELIEERVPYELRGKASLHLTGRGVKAEIAFPMVDGTSILETGPVREIENG